MALENPYCIVAQVQAELRNTDTTLNAALETAINQASRYVDEWTGRDWYQHDHTSSALYVRAAMCLVDGPMLWLPYSPIISLTSVTEAGTALVQGTDFVISLSMYPNRGNNALTRVGGDWTCGVTDDESIALVGKFGYAQTFTTSVPTGLPAHINRAAVMVAAAFSGHDTKEIVSADGIRDTVTVKSIAKDVEKVLGPRTGRVGT